MTSHNTLIGTRWRHTNGCEYNIVLIANEFSTNLEKYPVTVVYTGDNGKVWSRPLSDWDRSMTRIPCTKISST